MTQALSITEHYRQLLDVSSLMLSHARRQEWDALIQCEARYVVELDQARLLDGRLDPSETERHDKLALLEQILEQDAETRRLLDARRDELSLLIGSSRRQHALGQAYQGGHGSIASRLRSVPTDGRS